METEHSVVAVERKKTSKWKTAIAIVACPIIFIKLVLTLMVIKKDLQQDAILPKHKVDYTSYNLPKSRESLEQPIPEVNSWAQREANARSEEEYNRASEFIYKFNHPQPGEDPLEWYKNDSLKRKEASPEPKPDISETIRKIEAITGFKASEGNGLAALSFVNKLRNSKSNQSSNPLQTKENERVVGASSEQNQDTNSTDADFMKSLGAAFQEKLQNSISPHNSSPSDQPDSDESDSSDLPKIDNPPESIESIQIPHQSFNSILAAELEKLSSAPKNSIPQR